MKEELFSKKKERGVWDIEQEQHEAKMDSLEEEKQVLIDAINKIKDDTQEKRKNLLQEKEKYESLKLKIDQLERDKIEVERIGEENKEIKNVMLQRIRELEASHNKIQEQKAEKERELKKEKAKEQQVLEKLDGVKKQKEQLEETLKLSLKEKLDSQKSQEMRDKLHREQILKINQETDIITDHIDKLKEKLKSLEIGIRGKKMEMDDLDTKLKSLVHSRSRGAELFSTHSPSGL